MILPDQVDFSELYPKIHGIFGWCPTENSTNDEARMIALL